MNIKGAKLAGLRAVLTATFLGSQVPHAAMSQSALAESTHLVDVWLGSSRSEIARSLRRGRLELADGSSLSFLEWYQPQMREINLLMMTQLTPALGFLWGLSSGEAGEKYEVDPGLHVGFLFQREITERSAVSLQMSGLLGGRFQEKTCTASFGATSGAVPINCRLAATHLPPEETLRYLLRGSGWQEFRASFTYHLKF